MRPVFALYFFTLLFFSGCTNSVQQNQPNVYYDVAGFVQGQIVDLSASKPVVHKEAMINRLSSNGQSTRDIDWKRELELFIQADINKPALRSSYQIVRPDSLTYRYILKSSEERLTVRSLMVQLDSATHQPRRLEAVLQSNNPLYTSERKLSMFVGMTQGHQWRLRQYNVSGFQKLAFFDRTPFAVQGYVGLMPGELGPGKPRP